MKMNGMRVGRGKIRGCNDFLQKEGRRVVHEVDIRTSWEIIQIQIEIDTK